MVTIGFVTGVIPVSAWDPVAVAEDPHLRMPGTQPDQGVQIMGAANGPNACLDCHGQDENDVVPGFYWQGSMMAQAARDPIFWAALTVAGQDSIWATGNPNAVDLCERCHFPGGWLAGRSDPPNASAMTGNDFDGVDCDSCHRMWDPFFESSFDGTRESADWSGYWDEAGNTGPGSGTLSQLAAFATQIADMTLAGAIKLLSGIDFFVINEPRYPSYTDNGGGQFFMSTNNGYLNKRASFADADADHSVLYSRYHKSKFFCATCHDVSNPVLANLGLSGLPDQSGGVDQISEQYPAHRYFHVERTFSEFLLSAYGAEGGAATNVEYQNQGAPSVTWAASCQDCHMRDVTGRGATEPGVIVRPDGSTEHPNSGAPLHDLSGGNTWITYILASLDEGGPVFDATNLALLDQGPAVLTLDLGAGATPLTRGEELLHGSQRAELQLQVAATIKNLSYNPETGQVSLRIQNNTGHKLISGYPEGRRMYINLKAYADDVMVYEINPYDDAAGTLKGLDATYQPGFNLPDPEAIDPFTEAYVDELVYEANLTSSLTGETKTFHFALATGRYKDNRIPPKGFDIQAAPERLVDPVWQGVSAPDYFTAAEYQNGHDDVSFTIPATADRVVATLYYQGTSREYIEFLRDEINGTASSLYEPTFYQVNSDPTADDAAYLVQNDPFFGQLAAWGDTIWDLWYHNHGFDGLGASVSGIIPVVMTSATAEATLFTDGFESGDTSRWSASTP